MRGRMLLRRALVVWRHELLTAFHTWIAPRLSRRWRRYRLNCETGALEYYTSNPDGWRNVPEDQAPTNSGMALLGMLEHPPRRLHVHISETALLRHCIRVPTAAAGDLRKVLRLQLDRLAPLRPDLLDFACAITGRHGAQVHVELVFIRRTDLDTLITQIVTAAPALRTLIFVCRSAGTPGAALTLRTWHAPSLDTLAARWQRPLTASACALLALAVGLPLAILHHQNALLHEQLDALRTRAHGAEALSDEIDRRLSRIESIDAQLQSATSAVVLAELTERLPEDAWLFQLQRRGQNLELGGVAKDASTIAASLRRASIFDDVQLLSTTKTPGSNDERFQLQLRLRTTDTLR